MYAKEKEDEESGIYIVEYLILKRKLLRTAHFTSYTGLISHSTGRLLEQKALY